MPSSRARTFSVKGCADAPANRNSMRSDTIAASPEGRRRSSTPGPSWRTLSIVIRCGFGDSAKLPEPVQASLQAATAAAAPARALEDARPADAADLAYLAHAAERDAAEAVVDSAEVAEVGDEDVADLHERLKFIRRDVGHAPSRTALSERLPQLLDLEFETIDPLALASHLTPPSSGAFGQLEDSL